MVLSEALFWAECTLAFFPSARLDSEIFLSFLLGKDRVWIRTHSDFELSKTLFLRFQKFVLQRADFVPVAYILKQKHWRDFDLFVTPSVLIPRDETEVLLDHIFFSWKDRVAPMSVLDLGTGSGNIVLALKLHFLDAHVFAVDICQRALRVAKKNADQYSLSISFCVSRFFSVFPVGQSFDIIVANLPYVPASLFLQKDLFFEPKKALLSGEDGLDHYRELLSEICVKKIQFQQLWIEFLPFQKEAIFSLFSSSYRVDFYSAVGDDIFFACLSPL